MTNVKLDPAAFTTSPWASAQRTEDFLKVNYPSLKGMKVMLIVPDDHYRKKLMPLGPGYVATAMQRCDIDVVLKDFSVYMHDDIEIAKVLVESGIKIFAMGALYSMIREVERICNIIRAVVPDATIILGGSLPSPIPEFVLRRTGADIATIGEAEITIVHLMDAIAGNRNIEDVQGIAYIADGEFCGQRNTVIATPGYERRGGLASSGLVPNRVVSAHRQVSSLPPKRTVIMHLTN